MEIEEAIKKNEINNKTKVKYVRELEKAFENGNPIGKIETIKIIMNNLEKITKIAF
jgi:hypothetical protein